MGAGGAARGGSDSAARSAAWYWVSTRSSTSPALRLMGAIRGRPLGSMHCVRRSLVDAVGVGTGAVAADNRDLWLLAQPTGKGV